uniref:Uncharacterized protein n=1 Tax=Oryza punctata TaxID=4537 RepID=A0A0E0KB09_ORYPU
MGKRQWRSDADHRSCACAGGEAKRPRPEQKHLYLALDDWEKGYNLYKVDVHAFGSADTEAESRLAEPPVLQLEAAKGARDVLFAAVGTDILALWQPRYETTRTAVYDTEDHPEFGGTSLVSMGDAEFCIVESLTPKWMDPVWDRDEIDEYVLRVTRFRLKHDRHGQIRASSTCRRASYRVRKHDSVFAPQAFWM